MTSPCGVAFGFCKVNYLTIVNKAPGVRVEGSWVRDRVSPLQEQDKSSDIKLQPPFGDRK